MPRSSSSSAARRASAIPGCDAAITGADSVVDIDDTVRQTYGYAKQGRPSTSTPAIAPHGGWRGWRVDPAACTGWSSDGGRGGGASAGSWLV
jgi:hypothetical protein